MSFRLFTYVIPVDDGAAPNPYGGICTLAICKPFIRSVAQPGDWIAATGGKRMPQYSGKLVYAMRVSEVKTMEEYDDYCRQELPIKIPDVYHPDYAKRVGDCLYDFETGRMRPGVHTEKNREADVKKGKNALLSDYFYYFGDNAVELPEELKAIIKDGRWHRSDANDPYKEEFVHWLEENYTANHLYGQPQMTFVYKKGEESACGIIRCAVVEKDESIC